MKKLAFIVLIIFIIYSCSSSGDSGSSSQARQAIDSSIDLRLGQLASNNSVVAVSAALQNGESITAFFTQEGTDELIDVIYTDANLNTLLAKFDASGKPTSAQFGNTSFTYTDYTTENTVDISIQTPDSNRSARTTTLENQPIDQNTLSYINGNDFLNILLQLDRDSDSANREILAGAIAALRIATCNEGLKDFIDNKFISNICSSELLNKIQEILGFSNYQEITVNLINRHPECDTPQGYSQLSSCALVIWEDLTEAATQGVVGDYPRTDDGNNNNTGGSSTGGNTGNTGGETDTGSNNTGTGGTETGAENTPTPTPTSTPTNTPTPTPTPTNTPSGGGSLDDLRGTWSGQKESLEDKTGCRFFLAEDIKITGDDPLCANNCDVVGTLRERDTMNSSIIFEATIDGLGVVSGSGPDGLIVSGNMMLGDRYILSFFQSSKLCTINNMPITKNPPTNPGS